MTHQKKCIAIVPAIFSNKFGIIQIFTSLNKLTYATIAAKYKNGIKIPVDKTEFKKYFQESHKTHYLIGYLKGYDENSRSTYAKYLTVEVIKKLLDKGFDCTPLLISN